MLISPQNSDRSSVNQNGSHTVGASPSLISPQNSDRSSVNQNGSHTVGASPSPFSPQNSDRSSVNQKRSHTIGASPSLISPQNSDRLCGITKKCVGVARRRHRSPAYGIVDIALTIEKVRYEESDRSLGEKCDRTMNNSRNGGL